MLWKMLEAKILRIFREQLGVLSATELILQQHEPAHWIHATCNNKKHSFDTAFKNV